MRTKTFKGYSFLLTAILAFFSVAAMSQVLSKGELKGSFNEQYNRDVKVSGSVIVGVSYDAHFDGKSLASLIVFPKPEHETVCLSVESNDGSYTSRNEFKLPQSLDSGSPVLLPYGYSQHLEELAREYTDPNLALKATPHSCDEASNTEVVLPLHTDHELNTNILRVYVNTLNATDVFISTGNVHGSCQPIEKQRTNFDHVCSIALPSNPASDKTSVIVERERFGRELPVTEVVVVRGASFP
ncbi:hypothetical protein [Orrella sp. 11846]|uniref:hypothetical protein n=1 Tax=Orrella sp. 11846 TaxID=3409913 RepID=UPI003B599552